jgi:hypothetical protein
MNVPKHKWEETRAKAETLKNTFTEQCLDQKLPKIPRAPRLPTFADFRLSHYHVQLQLRTGPNEMVHTAMPASFELN